MSIRFKHTKYESFEQINIELPNDCPTGTTVSAENTSAPITDIDRPTEFVAISQSTSTAKEDLATKSSSVGKTYADIIDKYKNDPRVVCVLLLILPLPFMSPKSASEMLNYLIVGGILNFTWFILVPLFVWLKTIIFKIFKK